MLTTDRILFLCAGLQSSGTTLVSWCFLQRADMNGVLDAANDVLLTDIAFPPNGTYRWLKTTICCFRLPELIAHYEDLGWSVRPLLVCRDVRATYASLRSKHYGCNGTSAEDPPLRLRFRRFREDWELFQAKGWPILRYERLLTNPENTLRTACARLNLPWDDAMLTWPKRDSAILDRRHGNKTFHDFRRHSLESTIRPYQASPKVICLPGNELLWLEAQFFHYNLVNRYPARLEDVQLLAEEKAAIPSFGVTRRAKWRLQQTPLKYLLARVRRFLKRMSVVFLQRQRRRRDQVTWKAPRSSGSHPRPEQQGGVPSLLRRSRCH